MSKTLQSSKVNTNNVRSFRAPSLFAAFPEDLRNTLKAKAANRKFSAGQIIQQSGDLASGFWVIKSGQVKIGRYLENGQFQVILFMGPGDSYGEIAVFAGSGRIVDVVALRDTELFWVQESDLNDIISSDPKVGRELIRILSVQLQELIQTVLSSRQLSAPKILARSLLMLSQSSGGDGSISVSQDDLSELVGVSRMTISSALRDMEAKGMVKRGYREIEILDVQALSDY